MGRLWGEWALREAWEDEDGRAGLGRRVELRCEGDIPTPVLALRWLHQSGLESVGPRAQTGPGSPGREAQAAPSSRGRARASGYPGP